MTAIPVFKPWFGEEEWQALREPLLSGWVGLGPRTREFETKFAAYVGAPHAVGLSSATDALHLALAIAGVQGGEVITTPMTFVSTNHAILYNKATPVFADIEPDTLNISVGEIEKLVTARTRAIMVVHYGGHACDMDPIFELTRSRNILVIEDAAHACGTEYKGRRIGGLESFATCFSFHAVKNLATCDGGMITVHDPEQEARLRRLRWMGITRDTWGRSDKDGRYEWYYWVDELGFKCHMNDIAASIGLVQLGKLDRSNGIRRQLVERYNKALSDLGWLETPVEKPYTRSSCHNYVIKTDQRDELIQFLRAHEIGTSVHYIPNHLYDLYAPYRRSLPVTESVWKRIVTLPLFPALTASEQGRVIDAIRDFGKKL